MKIWNILAAALLFAPLAGCKTPSGIVEMERELRYQEDMIYQLQDYIHTYKSHLASCRAENQSLGGSSAAKPSTTKGGSGRFPGQPEAIPPSVNGENGNGDMKLPEIDVPEGFDNDLGGGPVPAHGHAQIPHNQGDVFQVVDWEGEQPAPAKAALASAEETVQPKKAFAVKPLPNPADSEEAVAQLSFSTQRTGPYDQDDQPGADGIQVWIEPRGASGKLVKADGEATVAVIDPTAPKDSNMIARWKIKSADLRRNQSPEGIRLKLRWPNDAPDLSEVLVFVRMVTADGLWIYSDQTVRLDDQLIDATQAIATSRPDHPPTVSPTAHDGFFDEPEVKEQPLAEVPEVGDKPAWTVPRTLNDANPLRERSNVAVNVPGRESATAPATEATPPATPSQTAVRPYQPPVEPPVQQRPVQRRPIAQRPIEQRPIAQRPEQRVIADPPTKPLPMPAAGPREKAAPRTDTASKTTVPRQIETPRAVPLPAPQRAPNSQLKRPQWSPYR